MADKYLVLLVLGVVCVNCGVLKGKALYCRDPETGKLHAVNTTWIASSFCGNYTCNLRKRNVNLTATAPIREFNITKDLNQIANETKGLTISIEKKKESEIQPLLHKIMPDATNMMNSKNAISPSNINNISPVRNYNEPENKSLKGHNCKKPNINPIAPSENDRYLTEKEIDSIADLLHTVKKSDLDAIVDIYNLAQDIYTEMDENANIENEVLNIMKNGEIQRNQETEAPSYWYDRLGNKERMNDRVNIDVQNALNLISTEKPNFVPPSYISRKVYNVNNDKMPYYYPVTQFQRISSYTHPSYSYKPTTQNANISKYTEARKDVESRNTFVKNKSDPRKLIESSQYLPYPFTNIHSYNVTDSRNSHYGSPWMMDYYNRYKYYQPYYGAYRGPIQRAILINPHLNNEVQDVEQHTVEVGEVKKDTTAKDKDLVDTLLEGQMTSNWKTGPVSIEVLKDIRAEIDTSRLLKAFPLRKMVKLEKVGKLMNMDDMNSPVNRNKRLADDNVQKENATEIEEYETYLEKVTCANQIRLGYFRIGNLTQPFPGCCPQLIDTR